MEKNHQKSYQVNNLIVRTMSIFTILFTIILGVIVLVQFFIFDQHSLNIGEILIIAFILFIISILLSLFYQINAITVFFQIITTYLTLIIFLYFLGFILKWFSLKNLDFIIPSLTFNIIGGIILTVIILVNRNKEIRDLNRDLIHYKGRDRR